MRQEHRAGEKLFVDYCGRTIPVVDGTTGNISNAEVFVAVLGASNFTYADATRTQTLPDWIGSHERALHFFGGVPEWVVPDNLRSGVSRSCRYDPDINLTYQEFAVHYGVAVMPARARRPKDKSKVEVGVQLVERWIHAKLRTLYFRLPRMFQELAIAKGDGRYASLLASFAKTDLLLLDDWGISPLSAEQRRDFLEILDDRHGTRSTMITSQFPVEHWHEIIGDPTLADAILDRVVHNAYKIILKGESMRKNKQS